MIVSAGSPVVLDVSALDLSHLEIHDQLAVPDARDYKISVSRVDLGGPVSFPLGLPRTPGVLAVGSVGAPFKHHFSLNLNRNHLSDVYVASPESNENMSFVVHGGSTLTLHGWNQGAGGGPRRTWLRLASGFSASPGQTSLTLESNPGWSVRDRVVIASTDYEMLEAEDLQLQSIAGNSVTFLPALSHHHHGVIERGLVDERAEVGLLSHNVRITSDVLKVVGAGGREDIRAGHVMFHNRMGMDPVPTVQIDYTEFMNLGWKGAQGRYPVHFHLLGNAPGCWIRNSSVHHCFNRSVTLHGTNQVQVEGVVAYDTYGHTFYLEDRSEVDNVFTSNLGLVTRDPTLPIDPAVSMISEIWPTTGKPYFCLHDTETSTYWITNTRNSILGNVAAGSARHGFWYDVGNERQWVIALYALYLNIFLHCDMADGLYAAEPVNFVGNVAHSNGIHGFFNDPVRLMPADLALSIPLQAENHFVDFTAYKNRHAGIWHRGYGVHRWLNARVADNRLGVYLASEGFQHDGMVFPAGLSAPLITTPFDTLLVGFPTMSLQTLENSVVIGESTNEPLSLPNPSTPYLERKGIVLYDGLILVAGTAFFDFVTLPIGSIVPSPPPPPAIVPFLTDRVAMAITSYTSHSMSATGHPWSVDPRNALFGCTFTNCTHPVLFPIPHAPSLPLPGASVDAPAGVATVSPNGIISTSVLDLDGSVPGSFPGAYLCNNTPMHRVAGSPLPVPLAFGHYAAPLVIGGPFTLDDRALAQVLVSVPPGAPNGLYSMTLSSVNSGQVLEVYDALGASPPGELKRFPVNVHLTVPGAAEEVYHVSYPTTGTAPSSFTLQMQFSVKDRSAVFRFPYPGSPTSVDVSHPLFPGFSLPWPVAATFADFQSGLGHWFHDSAAGQLWIRAYLFDGTGLGIGAFPAHPIGSGRAVVLSVQ